MSRDINVLQSKIKNIAPHALFTLLCLIVAFQPISLSLEFFIQSCCISSHREESLLKFLLLLDSNFILFLKLFKMIFEYTDVFQILQNNSTDITYSKTRINSLINQLKDYLGNEIHFNSLYSTFLMVLMP
nr:unnamed protein product [Callosobruchus chinensis]